MIVLCVLIWWASKHTMYGHPMLHAYVLYTIMIVYNRIQSCALHAMRSSVHMHGANSCQLVCPVLWSSWLGAGGAGQGAS